MSFPDPTWNRYEGSSRQASSRSSIYSINGEDSSYSSSNFLNAQVVDPQLYKTLTRLIDRFDIIRPDQSQQEITRQKERLLESYSHTLVR